MNTMAGWVLTWLLIEKRLWDLSVLVIDKLVLGLVVGTVLAFVGHRLARELERFKEPLARTLEDYRRDQAVVAELATMQAKAFVDLFTSFKIVEGKFKGAVMQGRLQREAQQDDARAKDLRDAREMMVRDAEVEYRKLQDPLFRNSLLLNNDIGALADEYAQLLQLANAAARKGEELPDEYGPRRDALDKKLDAYLPAIKRWGEIGSK